jgi:hypothetical protein
LHLLRVAVQGRSLDGTPVALERTGLALPVLTPAAFDALVDAAACGQSERMAH